ncbi:FMN-dependent NADH-azoreductase [Actinacidiphila yeochonensis]|uniref:FMN-dependent NADH-azoreductase n=1 Tax=Actinacidiphila yeochonensis TaxID=89050 RepID=UPI000564D178|nr:NAD(P)H-dependent oxidoreductase [Actinacidiphila yeochonensis]
MTTLFRLDASISIEGSHSRGLADVVEAEWTAAGSGDTVIRRDLGRAPLSATTWATAAFAGYTAPEARTAEQQQALAVAAELADELIAADAFLFAVPLYNFNVSSHFKAWVDTVLTDPRFAPGGEQVLAGRPTVLVTSRGGAYGEGTPRAGWDHATPWIQRILSDVWGLDVVTVEKEFTLVGVNPALDQFAELAAKMHAAAEADARAQGQALGARVSA